RGEERVRVHNLEDVFDRIRCDRYSRRLDDASGDRAAADRHSDARADCRHRELLWDAVREEVEEGDGAGYGYKAHVNSKCKMQNAKEHGGPTRAFLHFEFRILHYSRASCDSSARTFFM